MLQHSRALDTAWTDIGNSLSNGAGAGPAERGPVAAMFTAALPSLPLRTWVVVRSEEEGGDPTTNWRFLLGPSVPLSEVGEEDESLHRRRRL